MITQWILSNEAENRIENVLSDNQVREVQNFIIAWGFAERKITRQFGHGSLGIPYFLRVFSEIEYPIIINNFIENTYVFIGSGIIHTTMLYVVLSLSILGMASYSVKEK